MNNIDLTKSPVENIIALINRGSDQIFLPIHLTFDLPKVIEVANQSTINQVENTSLKITATNLSAVPGSKVIQYHRLDLINDFLALPNIYSVATGSLDSTILNYILTTRGLNLQSIFTGQTISPGKFKITADDNDLLYHGSITLNLNYT